MTSRIFKYASIVNKWLHKRQNIFKYINPIAKGLLSVYFLCVSYDMI